MSENAGVETPAEPNGRTIGAVLVALAVFTLIATGVRIQAWSRGEGRCSVVIASAPPLYDSGLLDALAKDFTARTGYQTKLIRSRSDLAPGLLAHGAADLAIVRVPGIVEVPRDVWISSRFVILGPGRDPAHIRGRRPLDAFRRIARSRTARFVADGSGTATTMVQNELADEAHLRRDVPRWVVSSAGSAAVVTSAGAIDAYTLVDLSTFASVREQVPLVALVESGLEDPYVILSPPDAKAGASTFAMYLHADETLGTIRRFGRDERGVSPFLPVAAGIRSPTLPECHEL